MVEEIVPLFFFFKKWNPALVVLWFSKSDLVSGQMLGITEMISISIPCEGKWKTDMIRPIFLMGKLKPKEVKSFV